MPLTDEERRAILATLGTLRRLLRSDEPMPHEVREVCAQILEHFEASVLVLDQTEHHLRELSDHIDGRGGSRSNRLSDPA